MYSVVVGDVLFVSQELETSNGVLRMNTPWVPIRTTYSMSQYTCPSLWDR